MKTIDEKLDLVNFTYGFFNMPQKTDTKGYEATRSFINPLKHTLDINKKSSYPFYND